MAYHDRQYSVFLLLGDPGAEPLWTWERGFELFRAFDPVVRACRGNPAVRVSQSLKTNRRAAVKFGRLTWTPAAFEQWVHGSPHAASFDWDFFFAEVSAPSSAVAARDGQPPDFFLTLRNEAYLTASAPVAFNPSLFVALAADLPKETHTSCRVALAKMTTLLRPRLAAEISRPWGFSFGSSGGFTQAIQDLPHVGLFRIGPPHARPVTLETLEEPWKPLT